MLSFSKTYELPLARDYCARWGLVEAVREILQNAIDSESPFEYSFGPDSLVVTSRFAKLSPATLLLGKTSKADNADAIGSFGEGYKIALLVLTRAGYPVVIRNGDRNWKPEFRHSRSFDAETLHIVESSASAKHEGVAFEIGGLSGQEMDAVRDSCLHMQSDIGEVIETPYGRILRALPGRLYVGGLFVCETDTKYGYDVLPAHLQLERDRQTVSGFDLAEITAKMWFATNRHEEVAQMIAAEAPEMKYAHWSAPAVVKEECFKIFSQQNPGAIVAATREALQEKLKAGMQKVVYIGGSYGEVIRSSPSHQALSQAATIRVAPPLEILETFFKQHRQHMRTPAIVAFKDLIRQARDWKIGRGGGDIPF
jgi:hypothetical protein